MQTSQKPRLRAVLDGTDNPQVVFRPTREFYSATGLRQKRFGQLYRGEKSPMLSELEALAKYLGKSVSEFIVSPAQPE